LALRDARGVELAGWRSVSGQALVGRKPVIPLGVSFGVLDRSFC
jgi:hypothetical protein